MSILTYVIQKVDVSAQKVHEKYVLLSVYDTENEWFQCKKRKKNTHHFEVQLTNLNIKCLITFNICFEMEIINVMLRTIYINIIPSFRVILCEVLANISAIVNSS